MLPSPELEPGANDAAEYTHNLRWRYRAGYGVGTFPEPYRGGGSYGRGYEWGEDRPPDIREGGAQARQTGGRVPRHRQGRRRYYTQQGGRRRHDTAPRWAAAHGRSYKPVYAPPGPYRDRLRRRSWRPGTAGRDYDRAYPYFASAAALEATSGYPPGETLDPDTHPRGWMPDMTFYGELI